jgi:ribosome-associated toxin RatA of RatAB toxin-antitoxin module
MLLFIIPMTSFASPDQWELEMEKEGIRVYTQLDGVSPYKQIKVTATINASMAKVLEILTAFSNYKTWMNHVEESYLLNQSDSAFFVFILEDAAWPMQNRYQVSKLDIRQTIDRSQLHFKAVPNYIEKRTDAIQIKQFEGYWNIQDRADHQCTLEYILIQNPGGHIPPWLANFQAVENPFQTVFKLRELAEHARIRP